MSLTIERKFKLTTLATAMLLIILYSLLPLLYLSGFYQHSIFNYDIDTARDLLDSLIQSLSTFFAIFISLVLVVIQLNASKYTSKIFRIVFYDSITAMAILFVIGIIGYDILVLSVIKTEFIQGTFNVIYLFIDMSVILTFIAFIIITGYVYYVGNLIIPDSLVNRMSIKSKKSINSKDTEGAIEGIELIGDIGKKSVLRGDTPTSLYCISNLEELGKKYISSDIETKRLFEVITFHPYDKFYKTLLEQFNRILSISIEKDDKSIAERIVYAIFYLGQVALKEYSIENLDEVLSSLSEAFLSASKHPQKRTYDIIPSHITIYFHNLYTLPFDDKNLDLFIKQKIMIINKLYSIALTMISYKEEKMLDCVLEGLKNLYDSTLLFVSNERLKNLWDEVSKLRESKADEEEIKKKQKEAENYDKIDDRIREHIDRCFFALGSYCLYKNKEDFIKIILEYKSKDELRKIYEKMKSENIIDEWDTIFLKDGLTSGSPAERYFNDFFNYLSEHERK